MIEMELGAPGISTVERCTRCAPESCHSIVVRASPGHGGPSGGLASRVHSPTSGSSRFSASSAVGWSNACLLPPVDGCTQHKPSGTTKLGHYEAAVVNIEVQSGRS